MSGTIVKGIKRSSSLPPSRRIATSAAKSRTLAGKSSHPKPIVKGKAEKAPAKKATKTKVTATPAKKGKTSAKTVATRQKPAPKTTKPVTKKSAVSTKTLTKKKAVAKPIIAKASKKSQVTVKPKKKSVLKKSALTVSKPSRTAKTPKVAPKTIIKKNKTNPSVVKAKPIKVMPKVTLPPPKKAVPPPTHKQPSPNEAMALRIFEKAHKEFVRGRFAESCNHFRELLEKHSAVVEVAARARTYLAIAEKRLKTETSVPKNADALYDRGVIELNRGEYAIAQEFFENALKREPNAAYIHYGLAVTKAHLGATEDALKSLEQAFTLYPVLRSRASQDQDLAPLHSVPEFEQLVAS